MAKIILLSAVALLAATVSTSLAAQEEAGKREYINSCAACHGETGRGDGPISEILAVGVSDLTTLSAKNGGTFPLQDIMMFIDGRSRIRAHGGEMPVWGERFVAEAEAVVTKYEAENVVKRRVLALALFLKTIQEK
ncbi:MAG: cytochrome c [Rhodobacteraceae bacterium]|nr:cytochrome c [Paracoccaceae bacterium]